MPRANHRVRSITIATMKRANIISSRPNPTTPLRVGSAFKLSSTADGAAVTTPARKRAGIVSATPIQNFALFDIPGAGSGGG